MTLEYSHNRHIKILALLLIVCLLVSFCFSFKADAAGAGVAAALYAVGGAAVVGSILHAMGIFHGDAHTDWDSLVTAVLGHLGSLGFVTADGKIKLSVLGAGVTMIPGAIISAVRDFLFSGDSPTLTYQSGTGPDYSYFFRNLSADDRNYINSHSMTVHCLSATYYSASSGYNVTEWFYLWVSGSGSLSRSGNSIIASYTSCSHMFAHGVVAKNTFVAQGYLGQNQTGDDTAYIGDDSVITVPSGGVTSAQDFNLAGADTLNPSDTPDVIYPGWAENAENVDTNIDVVADAGTGAIDGVITADKYYPIGIPDLGTSIYDQTQAGAQTGTKEDVITSEADAVKDSTKEDADSFAIGPMSDYTMQLKDFFPFCIPFDIYDLLNCLSADPEAPSFDWKIPVLGQDNIIHVDLAQFNTVASILRTMELLAFCVGLAFVTKHLIQGGAG